MKTWLKISGTGLRNCGATGSYSCQRFITEILELGIATRLRRLPGIKGKVPMPFTEVTSPDPKTPDETEVILIDLVPVGAFHEAISEPLTVVTFTRPLFR